MVVGSWRSRSAGGCKSALHCSSLSQTDGPWWGGVVHTQCRCGCWRCSVTSGGRAEGDVFGNSAFMVEHGKAGGTERLLRHLTYKRDDHGGGLFTLAAFRAGEPTRCLAHSEGRVG